MRKTVVVVAVLALFLVVVDRLAELVAERAAASHAAVRLDMRTTPDVEVDGFPFLTQVLARHFDQVRVTGQRVPLGRLTAGRLTLTIRRLDVDVRMPMESEAGSVRAEVLLPYGEVSRLAPEGVRVTPGRSGSVRVAAPVDLPGRSVQAVATSRVSLAHENLVVEARRIEVGGADLTAATGIRGRLDFSVPVDGLPGGLRLTHVRTGPGGLTLVARGDHLALARVAAALP